MAGHRTRVRGATIVQRDGDDRRFIVRIPKPETVNCIFESTRLGTRESLRKSWGPVPPQRN